MIQYSRFSDAPAVAMQLSRNILVAFIQVDLDESVLQRFSSDLLQRVHDTACRGVILDLSGLDTIDSTEFAALRRVMDMVEIMGSRAVLVGLRPGVVSSLIETGVTVDGLRAAADLDAAFAIFYPGQPADTGDDQNPEMGGPGPAATEELIRQESADAASPNTGGDQRE